MSTDSREESVPSTSTSPTPSQTSHSTNHQRASSEADIGGHLNGLTLNGHASPNGQGHTGAELDLASVTALKSELQKTREEKEALSTQYNNLLAKLTTMRTSLGNKLKQDAEELDRRELLIQQLSAQNDDLASTVETMKSELVASHEEAERASSELDAMRSQAFQDNAHESLLREQELREANAELERCRLERDEWESMAMRERSLAEESKSSLDTLTRELEFERQERERDQRELKSERQKSENLQMVLQDFQTAKEHEQEQAVRDLASQLMNATQMLAEFKHRALTAELQLEESTADISKTHELEKEIKEKNLQISKIRHEAVILNEHLLIALRRLRGRTSDTNVDARLVTNVLISFLTTPREDAKRFEMLSLLANILSWTDAEREKAGLQRAQSAPQGRSLLSMGRSVAKPAELEKTDETESFSRLWVEFLMTEASSGFGDLPTPPTPSRSNISLPGSPTGSSHPTGQQKSTRRLASAPLSSAQITTSSSPELSLASPPTRKEKEKASADS